MKHKIIYTNDYALIVSDEEIKDVRPFIGQYHLEGGLTINKFPNYLTDLGACKLIIAHRPLSDAPILKGIPLLPEFSQPKRPKYFEMEVYFYDNPVYNTYPKTKLISKCKTELVGEYSYE
jgi:hypothetical protein